MFGGMIEQMKQRKSALKNERSSFDPHWKEISDLVSVRTSRFFREDRNKGSRVNTKIVNETAVLAHRTLESGMMAGMSSPARPWFTLNPPDPGMQKFQPVKEWLSVVNKLMLEHFGRSNIYSVLPKTYSDIGGYGTAAFGIVDDEDDVFRCYPFSIGSYYLDCNDRMLVDTCHREFSMTCQQLIQRFGKKTASGLADWSTFSPAVKNAYDTGKYGTWFGTNHAVEPNPDWNPKSAHSRDKRYRSIYYEEGDTKSALSQMGYDDFPIIASRWHVNGEDVYGSRSPAMDALGVVKGVNLEERRKYQVIDKIWNPSMNADSTLRNSGADLLPGGLNWIPGMASAGNPGLRPTHVIDPVAVTVLAQDIEKLESRIRALFYADLMLMLATSENSQMTAREVEERHSEKLLVLGPMLEQQNDDTFDPLIDVTFNKMLARGLFPPPPEEIQGAKLRVEYTSTMAQAQKLIGVSALERFAGFVGNLSGFSPTALDKFDMDEAIDDYGIMTGVNPKIVRSAESVIEIRNARAEALKAQESAERMPAMVQGAQAAKTMAEIPTGGDNALTAMLSRLQGG
jgi:hypothetical protein